MATKAKVKSKDAIAKGWRKADDNQPASFIHETADKILAVYYEDSVDVTHTDDRPDCDDGECYCGYIGWYGGWLRPEGGDTYVDPYTGEYRVTDETWTFKESVGPYQTQLNAMLVADGIPLT